MSTVFSKKASGGLWHHGQVPAEVLQHLRIGAAEEPDQPGSAEGRVPRGPLRLRLRLLRRLRHRLGPRSGLSQDGLQEEAEDAFVTTRGVLVLSHLDSSTRNNMISQKISGKFLSKARGGEGRNKCETESVNTEALFPNREMRLERYCARTKRP